MIDSSSSTNDVTETNEQLIDDEYDFPIQDLNGNAIYKRKLI